MEFQNEFKFKHIIACFRWDWKIFFYCKFFTPNKRNNAFLNLLVTGRWKNIYFINIHWVMLSTGSSIVFVTKKIIGFVLYVSGWNIDLHLLQTYKLNPFWHPAVIITCRDNFSSGNKLWYLNLIVSTLDIKLKH